MTGIRVRERECLPMKIEPQSSASLHSEKRVQRTQAPPELNESQLQALSPAEIEQLRGYHGKVSEGLQQVRRLGVDAELHAGVAALQRLQSVPERTQLESRLVDLAKVGTHRLQAAPSAEQPDDKYSDHWRKLQDEFTSPLYGSVDDLLRFLRLTPAQAEKVRQLGERLTQAGKSPYDFTGLMGDIVHKHGTAVLAQVCDKLLAFLRDTQGSPQQPVNSIELALCALKDVGRPLDIDQRGKGTCVAASLQVRLAAEEPLRYVDMLTTLGKGQSFRLPDGSMLAPNMSWVGDSGDDRSLSAKIMQNAIMDLRGRPYHSDQKANQGMRDSEVERAEEKLFGYKDGDLDQDSEELFGWVTSKEDLWKYMEDDLARGRPVVVGFEGHEVLVIGIDKTRNPPDVILFSWGDSYAMSKPDFLKFVQHVNSVDDPGSDERRTPDRKKTVVSS